MIMSDKPNNFPRDGDHSTVTRDHIETLKANRSAPQQSLDYTIGGTTETSVHKAVESGRVYAINQGERLLQEASQRVQTAHAFAVNKGRAKADYIRQELKAAREEPPYPKSRCKEPGR